MGSDPLRLLAILVIGANVGLALWLIFRSNARWAMVAWAVALFLTPVYVNFSVQGIALTLLDLVTIVAIVSCWPGARLRWSIIDTLVSAAFVTLFVGLAFGGVWGHVQYTLVSWFIPYIWGRIALARVGSDFVASCVSIGAVAAASLAIVEFISGANLFVQLPGVAGAMWTNLQYRGGLLRAEGAFGHSISLGSSLAIASAFVLATRWRWWWKAGALTVVGTAIVMTLSRIGLVGLLLVVSLSIAFLGRYIRAGQRLAMLGLSAVAMLAAIPFITVVFDDAGDEAAGSADYRADLLPLVREMNVLGVSDARRVSPTGEDYFGSFRSIDSALILTGLRHGLLPLIIFIVMLLICVWVVVTGRGSPAAVAIVSQIPALATVALITQYSQLLWFVAGLAVTSYSLDASRRSSPDRDRLPALVRHGVLGAK
ncbi:hypothetical protein ACQ143_10795 [Microbacterium sp. MC2]